MKYKITFKKSAKKSLSQIPENDRERILRSIILLANEPRPHGCIKLTKKESYRIRQGNYRIIYTIDDGILQIVVIRVAHRKDSYKP